MSTQLLVVAPHFDDEVLGVGGCIVRAKHIGYTVNVVVVTVGTEDLFPGGNDTIRREASAAHKLLGVDEVAFMDFPAAKLDTIPHHVLNAAMADVFQRYKPDILMLPFKGDIHKDHQLVFDSAMVAARPNKKGYPGSIYCYETLSETNWSDSKTSPQFKPDVFIDISEQIEYKIAALECFRSQLHEFPHERSIEAVRSLAKLRGATVGFAAAEALSLVRMAF